MAMRGTGFRKPPTTGGGKIKAPKGKAKTDSSFIKTPNPLKGDKPKMKD